MGLPNCMMYVSLSCIADRYNISALRVSPFVTEWLKYSINAFYLTGTFSSGSMFCCCCCLLSCFCCCCFFVFVLGG